MKTTLRLLPFALALTLFGAGASASNFYGYKAPLPNVTITAQDNLLGFKVTVTTGGALEAFGANFRAASGNGSMGLYAADGANGDPGTLVAQTGSFAIDAAGTLQLPPVAPVTLAAGDYWIMGVFSQDAYPGYGFSTAQVIKYRPVPFSATLPGLFGATATYMGGKFNYYIKVAGSIHTVLFATRGKVPGAGDVGSGIPADAEFTDFGSPAISALGDVAVRATWTSATTRGVGIHCHILGHEDRGVAKVGDTVGSGPGSIGIEVRHFGGPIEIIEVEGINRLYGEVAFSTFKSVREAIVEFNLDDGSSRIVAQIGKPVAGTDGGVLKSIKSWAVTPDGRVLIEGMLAPLRGVVTAKTDHVLCYYGNYTINEGGGGLDIVAREGVTPITGTNAGLGVHTFSETLRTFTVFQPVRGSTGVARAFNGNGQAVLKATWRYNANEQDRDELKTGIVHINLP